MRINEMVASTKGRFGVNISDNRRLPLVGGALGAFAYRAMTW